MQVITERVSKEIPTVEVRVINPDFHSEAFLGIIKHYLCTTFDIIGDNISEDELALISRRINDTLCNSASDFTVGDNTTEEDLVGFSNYKDNDLWVDTISLWCDSCRAFLDCIKFAHANKKKFWEFCEQLDKEETLDT